MAKRIILFIFLLVILPGVFAIEFNMKDDFDKGETLIAKISGNFISPILKENILFYRGHTRVPVDPYVTKINDEFYIYAKLPETAGDYTMTIENAKYLQGTKTIDEDIKRNFSITDNTAEFSIDKGFVITSDDFSITTQNLQNSEITIEISITTDYGSSGGFFASLFGGGETSQNSFNLKSGEIKKINFNVKNTTQTTLKTITLSSGNLKYDILVYVFRTNIEPEKEETKRFRFSLSELNQTIVTNSNKTMIIYLENTGNINLENITLSVSPQLYPYVFLSTYKIEELKENSTKKIKVYFEADNEERLIEGQIRAKTSDNTEIMYAYLAVTYNSIKDFIPLDGEDIPDEKYIPETTNTCSDLSGKQCSENEECSGETKYASDGVCCLANCEEVKTSSKGKIIGWLLIFVILAYLFWFFKYKYHGTKKDIDLLKIAKGKK